MPLEFHRNCVDPGLVGSCPPISPAVHPHLISSSSQCQGRAPAFLFSWEKLWKHKKMGSAKQGGFCSPLWCCSSSTSAHKGFGGFHFPTAAQGRLLITWEGSREIDPDGKGFWLREGAAELLGAGLCSRDPQLLHKGRLGEAWNNLGWGWCPWSWNGIRFKVPSNPN